MLVHPGHGDGGAARVSARRVAARLAIGLGLLVALSPAGGGAAPRIGGPFALVDQQGAARTDADFRGSYLLVYFGFTYCPDLCPTTLLKVADAIDGLAALSPGKAGRVVPVFISVDPERDTPDVLRGYARDFHPRLVALTGTPGAVAKVGRAYGVFSAKVPTGEPGGYVVDHTSFVYLIGPDGAYVRHFEGDVGVDELVGALEESVAEPAVGGG